MTREDIEQLNAVEPYCFESDREEQWYNVGLKHGLEIADNNPKSQWISVEDDLPCKHPQLLEKVNYTQTVLVVLSWNDDPTKKHIETAYMCNKIGPFDVNWYWENRAHYHVTHWMPLPELPTKE